MSPISSMISSMNSSMAGVMPSMGGRKSSKSDDRNKSMDGGNKKEHKMLLNAWKDFKEDIKGIKDKVLKTRVKNVESLLKRKVGGNATVSSLMPQPTGMGPMGTMGTMGTMGPMGGSSTMDSSASMGPASMGPVTPPMMGGKKQEKTRKNKSKK